MPTHKPHHTVRNAGNRNEN
jgi:hypothetical protein